MAPNSVSIGSVQREIEKLKADKRALIGVLIDLHRIVYAQAKNSNAYGNSLELLAQNAEILKRLMDS
jgi:hypothetical protein